MKEVYMAILCSLSLSLSVSFSIFFHASLSIICKSDDSTFHFFLTSYSLQRFFIRSFSPLPLVVRDIAFTTRRVRVIDQGNFIKCHLFHRVNLLDSIKLRRNCLLSSPSYLVKSTKNYLYRISPL